MKQTKLENSFYSLPKEESHVDIRQKHELVLNRIISESSFGASVMSKISSDFDTRALTLKEVFGGNDFFQIPYYQRPYAWGDDEIEQLWDDIYSAFKDEDEYYFLGSAILANTGKGYFEVVDGQQRLTTLTILFCVLRDFFLNKLEKTDKNRGKQVRNSIRSWVEDKYRLILITQAQNQNQFEQEILEKTVLPIRSFTKLEKEKPSNKFKNAAIILKKRLDEVNGVDSKNLFNDLVKYIFENVVLITIKCSNRVSAIRLFRTLNTRGLELDLADLTKSYLLSNLENESKRAQFLMSWREIEKTAEDNDETVEDLLTYFGYYLIGAKPKRALNEEFERRFKRKDPNKIVYEIKKFSDYYDEILNTKSKTVGALLYLRDTVLWKTILVTARMKNFPHFKKICNELRRLYYSYWIADYTSAKTRDFSYNLIRSIKKGTSISELRKEIDQKMKEDRVLKWIKTFLEDDVYGYSWLKPLLVMIERAQTDESVYVEYGRNLHIDHILPEQWEKNSYWKKNWKKEDADEWLGDIGNLTLLSGSKNIRASNLEFAKKKAIYKGKGKDGTTSFEITKAISRKSSWKVSDVRARHNLLVKQACTILDIKLPKTAKLENT
jgi:uncharacterized protein with ParB-like and HNH nuclease domain